MRIIIHGPLDQVAAVTLGPLTIQVTSVSEPYPNRKGTPRLHRVYLEGEITSTTTVDLAAVRRLQAARHEVPAKTLPSGARIPAHPVYTVRLVLATGHEVAVEGDSLANLAALLRQLLAGLEQVDPSIPGSPDQAEPVWPVALEDFDHPFHPRGGEAW